MSSQVSPSLVYHLLFFPFIYLFYIYNFLVVKIKSTKCSTILQLPTNQEEIVEALKDSKQEILIISGITALSNTDGNSEIFLKYNLCGERTSISLTLKLFNAESQKKEEFHLRCESSNYQSTTFQRNALKLGHCWLEMREPFRRWRLRVQGTARNNQGEERVVGLQAWWLCSSDPSFIFDTISVSQLANIATQTGNFSVHQELQKRRDFIQSGVLRCRIEINGENFCLPHFLDFHGPRIRIMAWGERSPPAITLQRLTFKHFFTSTERHINYHLFSPLSRATLQFKQIFCSDQSIRMCIADTGEEDLDYPAELLVDEEDGCSMLLSVYSKLLGCVQANAKSSETEKNRCYVLDVQINESLLKGLYQYSDDGLLPAQSEKCERSNKLMTCNLEEKTCQNTWLTGGKASNLAKIIEVQLSDPRFPPNFRVPPGVVITTIAYQQFILHHPGLQELIGLLVSAANYDKSVLRELTERIAQEFSLINILGDDLLETEILKKVQSISPLLPNIMFAVRSSAVGEDSSELSSAGQLETFLNVPLQQVVSQIINCWASNFRWEIVNYRLENCLALDPGMGVVVQEMVTGGVAGVMFTVDPVRGDCSKAVLNMVRGDGEALVGGQVTPAQLLVHKSTLNIVEGGEDSELPLHPSRCLELVQMGVFLQERVFNGIPQDIEFVATDQQHNLLLQSRPITSLDLENEWELQHEFDTALWSPSDVLSTANVGEVLPNIQCPLHISVVSFILSSEINKMVQMDKMFGGAVHFRHYSCSSLIYRQRTFLNLTEIYLSDWKTLERDHISDYSLAGRRLYTKEMFDAAKARFPPKSEFHKICRLVKALMLLFVDSKSFLKRGRRLIEKCDATEISADQLQSPSHIFQSIVQLLPIMDEIIHIHTAESSFSNATYTFVAMLLRGSAEGDLTPNVLSDISTIYSNNPLKVVSADLPESLKKLAMCIKQSGHQSKFVQIDDPKTAMDWLLSLQDSTGEMCRQFFLKHGHRGPDELEFVGSTWDCNPAMLQRTIQALLDSALDCDPSPYKCSQENIFNQLKSTLTLGQRFGLKILIPHAHRGVWSREESKNYFVKVVHKLRHAFRQLAIALQKQNKMPEPELIFFLTLQEIKQLIQVKETQLTSTLVSRGRRRRRILESQAHEKYSLLNIGTPNSSESVIFEKIFKKETAPFLSGTCVCEGFVRGKARVVSSLKEAEFTKPEEILITKYTDIGWSPLFPIIRGLVTEIGGLLSHGAVVAREQGLPCLIAVQNATDFFHTGDEVVLNATHGTVELVKKA